MARYSTANEELQAVLSALLDEEKAERAEHADLMKGLSLAQKKAEGLAVYPLRFQEGIIYRGGRWKLRFEHDPLSHRITEGAPVKLFRDDEEADGIAVRISSAAIDVVVDDYPDWIEEGKIRLEASFPDLTWREMRFALQQMLEAEDQKGEKGQRARLRDRLLGYTELSALTLESEPHRSNELNASQNQAVIGILNTPDFAVVHGPPGTGKTTTLVAAIAALYRREESVLVCAATNAAVDLLALKLDEQGIPVLRIGHPARVYDAAQALTLEGRMESRSEAKLLAKYRAEAAQLFRQARRFRRSFGAAERAERESLFAEYRALQKTIREMEKAGLGDIIERTPVICATLTGASHPSLREKRFTTVVIDEATQALEPACYIPLLKNPERIVMAGDHHQLAPLIRVPGSPLSETLFEKMIKRHKDSGRVFFLNEQYRMQPVILGFSNQRFYEGLLVTHDSVFNRPPLRLKPEAEVSLIGSLLFVDTAGSDATEEQDADSESRFNRFEAMLLVRIVERMLRLGEDDPESVALIAPYRAQVDLLRSLCSDVAELPTGLTIEVDTVDSFQGSERDWIGVSFTRNNEEADIGFLKDLRRTNVAMTRARRRLILVGDSTTLSMHPFYADLIAYAQSESSYFSVWEEPFASLVDL